MKQVHCSRRSNLVVRNLSCDFSFADSGLGVARCLTQGLRRGLHSYAASRLKVLGFVPLLRQDSSAGLMNVPGADVKAPQWLKPGFLLTGSATTGSRALSKTITHGLRRALYSYSASRLKACVSPWRRIGSLACP